MTMKSPPSTISLTETVATQPEGNRSKASPRAPLAMEWLNKNAGLSWSHWSPLHCKGLRSLRDLTFSLAKTRDLLSQAYKQQLNDLLRKPKYAAYIGKERQGSGRIAATATRSWIISRKSISGAATLAPHDQRRVEPSEHDQAAIVTRNSFPGVWATINRRAQPPKPSRAILKPTDFGKCC